MHTVEETSRLLRLLVAAELRLQFFDTRIGALERLVLDEGCLHQRVGGLRRASQAVRDHALGSRVARAVLQFGQAIKQFRTLRKGAPGIDGQDFADMVGSVNSGPPSMPDMPVAMPYPRS